MVATRTVPKVIVQTASNLEASNSGWTTQRWLTCLEWSDGAGTVAGYAKLSQWYGLVARLLGPNSVADLGISPNVDRSGSDSLVGQLVRVCAETSGGTITEQFPHVTAATGTPRLVNEPAYFSPVWHGVIRGLSYTVDGDAGSPGGLAEFEAVGMGALLDQVFVDSGLAVSASGSTVTIGRCPPFNAVGNGDRALSTVSSIYPHDLRTLGGSGTPWTARDILDSILLLNASQAWSWTISDSTGALGYTPAKLDLHGLSVLEALNELAGPRRGLTWRMSISGGTVSIVILSTSAVAIDTLPASTQTTTLSIGDQPWLSEVSVEQDSSATYDKISIIGRNPWVSISLEYNGTSGALRKGWTPARETAWNSATVEELASDELSGVWRRFVLAQDWNGEQYGGGSGLRNLIATATSSAQGAGGLTGARSFSSGTSTAPASMLEGERMTPFPAESSGSSATDERLTKKRPPMVFYFNGTSWDDLSTVFTVTVESSPLAVQIDDKANGEDLRDLLAVSGAKLVVTIGLREAQPLVVSWIASPSTWPCAMPRQKMIEVAAEQEAIITGTVTGASGASLVTAGAAMIRDDVAKMQNLLSLARGAWGLPIYTLRWVDRGRCLTGATVGTYAPGTLITALVDGASSTPVNAVVLRRTCSWQGDHWATSLHAERMPPDVPTK